MDFRVERLSKIRTLPRPEDGLRALAERAPQAEAFAEQTMERLRPALAWAYASRRRLATTAVCLLTGWLFFHVMFGANGMVVYQQKHAEFQDLQREIDSLQKENDHHNEEIKALQTDPKTIEKEAREKLHYARPGEVVYVAHAPASQPPDRHNARK
jgi:cell division protein FtsB